MVLEPKGLLVSAAFYAVYTVRLLGEEKCRGRDADFGYFSAPR
jgi:hypothetical protein